jgi:phage-related holin
MKDYIIGVLHFLQQLGKLSVLISILFFTFYLFKGINIFANYGRLGIVLGVPLFVYISCHFLLKRLRKDNKKTLIEGIKKE